MDRTLIATISGIRGIFGRGLDPATLVRYVSAYGAWVVRNHSGDTRPTVIVGRDGRSTGAVCAALTVATLQSCGCDVVDAGMATTPTVEMAVIQSKAAGGIILSASHNPAEWNALKLLNSAGEFLSPAEAEVVLAIADAGEAVYVTHDKIGTVESRDFLDDHIEAILALPFIDPEAIANRRFRVVVDGINSIGGIAVPALLTRLGIPSENITCLHCEPTGQFAHEAEPLPGNLVGLIEAVREHEADLGIAVDPDVDRLALVLDGGTYMSEELTQVVAADFLWRIRSGPFVTNLSSSRAIDDLAQRHGQEVYRSAVGEINVVKKMQAVDATLGGEGNGGVILPDLHYGRDALAGIAIVLQHLANTGMRLSELRATLPNYTIAKHKISVRGLDPDRLLDDIASRYPDADTIDGVKISFERSWVHLRKSNTEPILRIYTEAESAEEADALAKRFEEELVGPS
jgi:phosphomannomutase